MDTLSVIRRNGRIHSLDGLRAFSIGLVLLGHLAGTAGSPQFLASVHSLGNYGVRFFFVISGFLITWLLLTEQEKTGTVDLKRFFTNRVLRIFPAFYVYVGIGAVMGFYGIVELLPGDLLHAASYTMNYHDERAWHLNHTWSLAVEEQFYLIWPFAFLVLGRKHAPALLLALILLVPCIRAVMWFGFDASPTAVMRQFQAVADALAVGCLMAFALRSGRLPILRRAVARACAWGLAVLLLAGSAGLYLIAPAAFYVVGQSMANVGAAAIVCLCITKNDGIVYWLLNNRVAVFVGVLSYSLYLWQEPFLNSTVADFPQTYPFNLAFTFTAALASYFLVEKPFLRLKEHDLGAWREWIPDLTEKSRAVAKIGFLFMAVGGTSFLAAGEIHSLVASNAIRVAVQEARDKPGAQSVLRVFGRNDGQAAATVVVRLDDMPSPTYWNRVNIERQVLPGRFELEIPLGGLRTQAGRAVRPEAIRDIVVFSGAPVASIVLERVAIEVPAYLPPKSFGWDFGPDHAAVFSGFTKVGPNDPGISGETLTGLQRPAGDALISDGIRGLERFETAVPNGRWRVTLWTEDLGEWQTLPYWTRRVIAINGKPISETTRTAEDWFHKIYTAGADREAVVDGDLWDLTAGRRGGLVSGEVEVTDHRLVLELDGDLSTAGYVAGLLIEPADQGDAAGLVQEHRKRVFEKTWRLVEPVMARDAASIAAFTAQNPSSSAMVKRLTARLARGDSLVRDIWLSAPPVSADVDIAFVPGRGWPAGLAVELRYGMWGFRRTRPSGTVLQARADRLSDVAHGVRLTAGLRRRLNIRAVSGLAVSPGLYSGNIVISHQGGETVIPIDLSVMGLSLPPAEKAIGVYLEEAPHLSWFSPFAGSRSKAVSCDLSLLHEFGLTAVSPPFSLPQGGFAERHLDMAERVHQGGYPAPTLSYASFKWMAKRDGLQAAAGHAGTVTRTLASSGLGPILWSVADEPGNIANGYDRLRETVSVFRSVAPDAPLAGHLNHKKDRAVLDLFDTVLVNPGYGVDRRDIDEIREQGVSPWFYNMGNARAAAGFYLWRAGADGYLQWHARMPTADPFDPTDGREDDFQFLYPSLDPCGTPDIHEDLVALSRGIADFRWLLWLEGQAETDPGAKRLVSALKSAVPDRWEGGVHLDNARLTELREKITGYAAASARSNSLQNAASN